jgi:membrane peptidoglycan carboxypeptidase
METKKHSDTQASRSLQSHGDASQYLVDRSLPTPPAYRYDVPHHPLHSTGWRLRRHLKRKWLHRTIQRSTATDHVSVRLSILPIAFVLLALVVALGSVLVGYTSFSEAIDRHYQGEIITLADILPKDSLRMYDAHGTLIYEAVDQGLQISEPFNDISLHLVHAEIAIEDHTFWINPGYDITGMVRATISNLSYGRIVSGGSTITQQLIKNTVVGNEDTILRKLEELILAPQATRSYSKEQIMDMYLNTTYYGNMAYGAEAAAFVYFDLRDTPTATAAAQLDIAQSAMLAGIPQDPVLYDPFLHPQATFLRMQVVLNQMQLQGSITPLQERQAIAEAHSPHFLHHGIVHTAQAPHFVSYALGELATILHVKASDLSRSGLVVHTTLDLPLQNKILHIAQQNVAALSKTHHLTDAAEVLIDFHNGDIRVLLGNIDPNNPHYGQFDVATQGYRQPGSAFKPFVYATAFEQGLSPGMPVLDVPTRFPMCCGLPSYMPHNYDLGYHGLISIRAALQNSFNVPGVKVLYKAGVDASLHSAQEMGISSYQGTPNYTMVLGTLGVHLLDITSAYGVFANRGVRVPPHTIEAVSDTQGHVLYHIDAIGQRVISPQVAYLMTNVLSDNQARTYEFGACSSLYLYTNTQTECYQGHPGTIYPSAVKTGTSQNFADNWTVGYSADYVMGVWAGNNDNSPMLSVLGVTGAGSIWHEGMLLAERSAKPTNFIAPPGLVKRTVSYPEGLTTTDWYIKGIPLTDWGLGWRGSL